jgi:hypothetical protein
MRIYFNNILKIILLTKMKISKLLMQIIFNNKVVYLKFHQKEIF